MDQQPLRLEYLDPIQLTEHPGNWKFHPPEQLDAIESLVGEVGWAGALLFNEATGHLLDGHGRRERFAGKARVPVLIGSWPEEQEAQILATLDPTGWMAVANKRKVEALLGQGVKFQADQLNTLLKHVKSASQLLDPPAETVADGEARPDEDPKVLIPLDSIWPTDNAWSVPALDPALQAFELPHPVQTWGSIGHSRPMFGTWHFYIHDNKFEPLWKRPERVLLSRPGAAVEPNFSTTPQTPSAVMLWHVYRKRWLARYWQSQGLRIFVDLNVSPEFNEPHESTPGHAPNLLGVPSGWRAFATRAHANVPENLLVEWEVAKRHAGTESVLFLVVGGGREVKKLAQEHAWLWVPEQMDQKRGGKDQSTEGGE